MEILNKLMVKRIYIVFTVMILSLCISVQGKTQVITEQEVQSQLDSRGLEEAEVRAALIERGINIDNIENFTPAEIGELEAVILELEAEKSKENDLGKPDKMDKSKSEGEGVTIDDLKKVDALQDTIIEKVEEELNDEVQKDLPKAKIYGQEIFRNKTIKVYRASEEIKAPDYYVLGVGDEVGVSVWGRSQFDAEFVINKDGFIKILNNKVRVQLKGLTLAQAREKLKKVFRQYYSFQEGQFEITLNYSRTIQVSVYGDVLNPGPISIPAINTAFSALVAVNGPNDIGSVRKIKLVKNTGDTKLIDVYEYMNDPSITQNFYLEDGDIIVVPVATKVITIEGAVQRPFKYELLKNEDLKALVEYSGGLKEDAYSRVIQVKRFDGDRQKIIDVPYVDLLKASRDFKLVNGDVVTVKTIGLNVQNFVSIKGEVIDKGDFERTKGMRISDLVKLAGLKKESKTDVAFLIRSNPDKTSSFLKISIDNILNAVRSDIDLVLQDGDRITIWSKERFADQMVVSVEGAVREPSEYEFDAGQQVRVKDLITLSGGLRRDASPKAIIQRIDPLRSKRAYYDRVDLSKVMEDENSKDNMLLTPYDKLIVYSENVFLDEAIIEVEGAVNTPGEFVYGENMELKDALLLSGGFKFGAALNKVEISRIVFTENQPTKIIIANLELDDDFNIIETDNPDFSLQPYDAILVRYVPDFELQKFVVLKGEVKYPGSYPIISENEKISSIIDRAGGLTGEGFSEGARLVRPKDDVGNVVIKLQEIMENSSSRFNFIVQDGDVITVPKKKEFVTIVGATRVSEVLSSEAVGPNNEINVPYHPGKNAKFYIDEYAGGIADNGKKSSVFVEYANGEIKRTRSRLLYFKYPPVKKGSTIKVGVKPPQDLREEQEKESIDWGKILADSVAQATTVLTLVLLVQSLD